MGSVPVSPLLNGLGLPGGIALLEYVIEIAHTYIATPLTNRSLQACRSRNNQALVWCSVKYSNHPIRTAAYFMLVVGCSQILIWTIPSLVLAPFRTSYSLRARANLMKGVGKLFWSKWFRFNFY